MPPRNKGVDNVMSDEKTWDFVPYGSSSSSQEGFHVHHSNSIDDYSSSSTTTRGPSRNLPDLPQSIKLHILQFLDLISLAQSRAVNRDLHQLLQTSPRSAEEAYQAVWKPAVARQWPWLETNDPQMRLQDSCFNTNSRSIHNNNTLLTTTTGAVAANKGSSPDLAHLLSLAADTKCHAVDQDLLIPPKTTRARDVRHGRLRSSRSQQQEQQEPAPQLHLSEGSQHVVIFSGALGVGDRCARAKDPLPHPTAAVAATTRMTSATPSAASQQKPQHPKPKRRLQYWCKETAQKLLHLRPKTKSQQVMASMPWKPFVAPFADSTSTYNLSPRLVSYFEILILPSTENTNGTTTTTVNSNVRSGANNHHPTNSTNNNNNNNTTADCVAVGVALREFPLHKYMPGWCPNSFGYHGDDGGFYHASGHPHSNVHLPTYGAGDCVGCGLDYIQRALFFTKNGQFLGYVAPLSEEQLGREWFPVVGVDTHCPVQCNFGTSTDTPFRYDLSGLVKLQREVVLRALEVSSSSIK